MSKLTVKQRAFVDAYCGAAQGNATEAARMAGYKGNAKTLGVVGVENLAKPSIAAAVKERADAVASARIATIEEIQQVLTEIIRNPGEESHHRINASKELAKMQGGYAAAKLELTGKDGGPVESKSTLDASKLPTDVLRALVAAKREQDA